MANEEEKNAEKTLELEHEQDVYHDQRGVPIATPAVEVKDFSPAEDTSKRNLSNAGLAAFMPKAQTPNPQRSQSEIDSTSMPTARRTITENNTSDAGFSFPQPKRTRTAPNRPRPVARRTTVRNGIRRTQTGTSTSEGNNKFFEYKFEDVSSDSDSSLSSDDDEKDNVPETKPAQPAQPLPGVEEHDMEEEHDTGEEHEAEKEPQSEAAVGEPLTQPQTTKSRSYSRFAIGNDFFRTKGRVSRRDGRLKISINETTNSGYLSKALGQSIRNHLDIPRRDQSKKDQSKHPRTKKREESLPVKQSQLYEQLPRPYLNIVIMVIGSRGDIQPFLKIGKILRHEYGHRVRIASHPTFRDFVQDNGLEFFSVGGDPSELMAFMVKNPGLIPNVSTLRDGEIPRRRASMAEMFEGFWRACVNATDDEHESGQQFTKDRAPFVADAIIANPPSMAHVHIAERLGIPLHMMFTFPYSPTTQFPHPLANIKMKKSNVDENYVNFMSYSLVELLTWQGLGDIVNRFRENTLGLEPVSQLWAPGALYRMKVPYTYMWSPSLVPKPRDWGPEIDIAGFVFLEQASNFKPSQELSDFLDAGEPPVYIGFGSIVVDDPDKLTDMIFKAAEIAGVRALVNKGWGGFGRDNSDTPDHIFMLGNTPHDWLFPRVKAVIHHGGAGTTAIGLKCGKPTMIVPFFGDQPFWGAMVAEAKAGAHECIPYKKLTAEKFAEGIKQCLLEESQRNVQKIADSIANEGDGAENAVKSFHRSLPLAGKKNMRCSILQERVAVWKVHKTSLRLSALAAEILTQEGKLKWSDLKLARHYEWNDFDGPGEPITGTIGAITDSLYGIGEGFGMVPVRVAKHIRKREEHERRKRERQKRRELRAQKREQASAPATPAVEMKEAQYEDNGRPPTRREDTNTTQGSTLSADPTEPLPMEVIDDLNWGLKRAGAAILTLPNDLHVAIAQGFHNAPRLWGDATVRKPIRITGVKSGFVAARKEFTYGMYDGWTGLVKQPKGDWEDGETLAAKFAGLGTGFGKGLGGFVLKTTNAFVAPPAFVVKGFVKYIEKRNDGPGSKAYLRHAQIVRGERDLAALKRQSQQQQQQQKDNPNNEHEASQDSQHNDTQDLQSVYTRIHTGYQIYTEIWNSAHREFGPVTGNWVGKYRVKKERRNWDVNGALEDVHTARQALEAREEGKEAEREFLKQRSAEQEVAGRARVGAMGDVGEDGEGSTVAEGKDGSSGGGMVNGKGMNGSVERESDRVPAGA